MFIADLHIHSRFSMATSRQLTLPHLAGWAMCKGIHVLGTGDFTHPAWQAELKEGLVLDEESGFYKLKGTPERILVDREIRDARPPLFCLQTEISSIYKRGGKSRRIHNCVYFPTLEDVERFSKKLGAIGNINSDGRPILGLDARDLLELVLETCDRAVVIPAHIWTPWFSLFGSRSGFDAIEECFGDLTRHIFALETGLSSDPAMNRLVSALDNYVLISNSDAHSGPNLGREANVFDGRPSYDGMFRALREAASRSGHKDPDCSFEGTLEIYPEEGKYHLDGHRACNVVMTPAEAQEHGNICPVCGKPLTIGVLHRVWELADRKEEVELPNAPAVHPIIPLPTVLAQIHETNPQTKKVQGLFKAALENLGSEFAILAHLSTDEIARFDEVLGLAVQRIRERKIELHGGYDGEFGTISVFTPEDLASLTVKRKSGSLLTGSRSKPTKPKAAGRAQDGDRHVSAGQTSRATPGHLPDLAFWAAREQARDAARQKAERQKQQSARGIVLTDEQEAACSHRGGPLLVLAGPGSGKTRLLTERLGRLLEAGIPAHTMLALTFSRKAGEEIAQRVRDRVRVQGAESGNQPQLSPLPFCGTFHSFAWQCLRKLHSPDQPCVLLNDSQASVLLARALETTCPGLDKKEARALVQRLELLRERCLAPVPGSNEDRVLQAYSALKLDGSVHRYDFADLLEWMVREYPKHQPAGQFAHVLVDEVQDLSPLQLAMLAVLLPDQGQGFFGIGDPDQSIYGFRGAVPDVLSALRKRWPSLSLVRLGKSFRSSQQILDVASCAMRNAAVSGHLQAVHKLDASLVSFDAPSQGVEERWVADRIAELLGPTSHTALDMRGQARTRTEETDFLVPSDIAVLVRLRAQIPSLQRLLTARGIPVQAPALSCFWQDEALSRLLAFMEEQIAGQDKSFGLGALAGQARSTQGPAELAPWLKEQGQLDEDMVASAAWKELCRAFARLGSWERLFEDIAWQKEADLLQEKAQSVRLLTMHAAKGLEFRAVFLPGFNDGLMPHVRELLQPKETGTPGEQAEPDAELLAEERRLLYVALTRASEAVYISRARTRTLYGRELELETSRFFADIRDLFSKKRLVRHEEARLVQRSLV